MDASPLTRIFKLLARTCALRGGAAITSKPERFQEFWPGDFISAFRIPPDLETTPWDALFKQS